MNEVNKVGGDLRSLGEWNRFVVVSGQRTTVKPVLTVAQCRLSGAPPLPRIVPNPSRNWFATDYPTSQEISENHRNFLVSDNPSMIQRFNWNNWSITIRFVGAAETRRVEYNKLGLIDI